MSRLSIRHESVYQYSQRVRFGPWRLLMRPLDTHATRLISAWLEVPPADTRWSYDAYGNCVCYLTPSQASDRLRVVNNLVVDRFPSPTTRIDIESPSSSSPIIYSPDDRAILAPFMAPATDDTSASYLEWLRDSLPERDEPAITFLSRLTISIHRRFIYGAREEEGTQGPDETIRLNSGTCRDFAWLMIETVRRLGYAARFATGYLFSPGAAVRGAGATHAWCEVFLPDLGWTEFDPTNGLVESSSLIRIATTRTWREADPMNGTIYGDAACQLTVAVDVDLVDQASDSVQ